MRWLFFSIVFVLIGFGFLIYDEYRAREHIEVANINKSIVDDAGEANALLSLITTMKSKGELLALESRVTSLKGSNLKVVEPVWRLAIATVVFEEGESCLAKAIELNTALKPLPPLPTPAPEDTTLDANRPSRAYGPTSPGVPPPLLPPPPPPLHPLVVKKLEDAFKHYKESKELCDRIQQSDNTNFNFALNYFKGEVYYRHTQFLSTKETAKELFDQTLNYWKHALRYKSRDIDTVINIELLIKNQHKMLGESEGPPAQRPKMLPQGLKAGRVRLKGI